jgi:pyruvate,water dikinase
MEAREREIRARAEARVARALGPRPGRRWFFGKVLANARKNVRNRENLRFARTKIFGLCREIFNAAGRKLVAAGALQDARDVYHLTVPELWAYIEGRAVTTRLHALAQLRKAEFAEFRQAELPDRFSTYGVPYLDEIRDGTTAPPPSSDPHVLLGVSCCPGVVKGPVRVILSASDDLSLDGQILVAARTDPGWVPLYPSAAGLLIERGSILSHSAIVARELGLPAIVGIRDLTKRVTDGQQVEMDGSAGTVRLDA